MGQLWQANHLKDRLETSWGWNCGKNRKVLYFSSTTWHQRKSALHTLTVPYWSDNPNCRQKSLTELLQIWSPGKPVAQMASQKKKAEIKDICSTKRSWSINKGRGMAHNYKWRRLQLWLKNGHLSVVKTCPWKIPVPRLAFPGWKFPAWSYH